jgi:hypothetical protein
MHDCIANIERHAMISALPSSFSVHVFHFDPEIDMDHLVPGCSAVQLFIFVVLCSWI